MAPERLQNPPRLAGHADSCVDVLRPVKALASGKQHAGAIQQHAIDCGQRFITKVGRNNSTQLGGTSADCLCHVTLWIAGNTRRERPATSSLRVRLRYYCGFHRLNPHLTGMGTELGSTPRAPIPQDRSMPSGGSLVRHTGIQRDGNAEAFTGTAPDFSGRKVGARATLFPEIVGQPFVLEFSGLLVVTRRSALWPNGEYQCRRYRSSSRIMATSQT
jgi:hypothetical protein